MYSGVLVAFIVAVVSSWDFWIWILGAGPVGSRLLYLVPAFLLFYGLFLRKMLIGGRFFSPSGDSAVGLLLLYIACQTIFYFYIQGMDFEGIQGVSTFVSGVILFYTLTVVATNYPDLRKYLYRVWQWAALTLYLFTLLQGMGQISGLYDLFFDYMRTREYRAIWPVTSFFAEPAMLAQFIMADLFARFRSITAIRKQTLPLALAIASLLLTQSMGGLWGAAFWAILVGIREGRTFINAKHFARTLVITGVLGVVIVSSLLVARLPIQAIFDWSLLDVSGTRRVDTEFRSLLIVASQTSVGEMLFGLGDSAAASARSMAGFSDNVSGNGLIEIIFRYGLLGLLLTLLAVTKAAGKKPELFYLLSGVAILTQIDGAIAKPNLWLYFAVLASSAWDRTPELARRSRMGRPV